MCAHVYPPSTSTRPHSHWHGHSCMLITDTWFCAHSQEQTLPPTTLPHLQPHNWNTHKHIPTTSDAATCPKTFPYIHTHTTTLKHSNTHASNTRSLIQCDYIIGCQPDDLELTKTRDARYSCEEFFLMELFEVGRHCVNLDHTFWCGAYIQDIEGGSICSFQLLALTEVRALPGIRAYFFGVLAYTEDQYRQSAL